MIQNIGNCYNYMKIHLRLLIKWKTKQNKLTLFEQPSRVLSLLRSFVLSLCYRSRSFALLPAPQKNFWKWSSKEEGFLDWSTTATHYVSFRRTTTIRCSFCCARKCSVHLSPQLQHCWLCSLRCTFHSPLPTHSVAGSLDRPLPFLHFDQPLKKNKLWTQTLTTIRSRYAW